MSAAHIALQLREELPFGMKPIFGLIGILTAALTVEFNDVVTSTALADVQGGLGISHDAGTWIVSLYATGQVIGMTQATWWAVTVSIRRFALFAIALSMTTSVLIPLTSQIELVYALRFVGGLSAGFTIPLLLTTALQVLPPPVRLYGLAAYALTATFGPNVSAALAALWTDGVSWQFVFLQDIPLCALSSLLVWYGMPQQPPRLERLPLYDWSGTLLVLVGFGAFTTMLEQGDRLDWFNSSFISVVALVSAVALPLLLLNEGRVPSPLFKFYLLKRRNVSYALIALFIFLLLNLSASAIPISYLAQVAGFRPLQAYVITAVIAASQLVLLPLTAVLLNFDRVDSRVITFVGVACIVAACIGDSFLTSVWQSGQFLLWQGLQAVGGPLIVVSLLLMATNKVEKPEDGLYGSTLVNTTRGLAEPVGVWLLQLIARWRGGLHYNRIVDQSGQGTFSALQHPPGSITGFSNTVAAQANVLALSDAFLVIGALGIALAVVLLMLPVRTYPPRIIFAKK